MQRNILFVLESRLTIHDYLADTLRRQTYKTLLQAQQQDQPSQEPSIPDGESRVEALESSLRAKKGSKPSGIGTQQSNAVNTGGMAEWKEGQLFPEGWETMDPLQKATEIYMGKRGFLFWSNRLAFGGVFVLVAAWVVFRFVGPALGLYQLANDLTTPNF